MFKSTNTAKLRRQINRFTIPMFIVEMRLDQNRFEVLAINESHEQESGMSMAKVANRSINALFPEPDATKIQARYSQCLLMDEPLRYREQLPMERGTLTWDTTLYRLPMDNGRLRVLGSSVLVKSMQRDARDIIAFEDVRYFAAASSMQLSQIASVLDAAEQHQIDPARLLGSVGVLAGLCRTIDSTMQELRAIADERLTATANRTVHLMDHANGSQCLGDELDEAVRALNALVRDVMGEVNVAASPARRPRIDALVDG